MDRLTLSTSELEEMLVRAARLGAEQFYHQAKDTLPERPLTKAAVAKYLNCSIATVDRYMKDGLPFVKPGNGHPKFYRSAIDSWKSANVRL